jgi:acyl-CoA synthetase (NDP forming)
MKTTLGFNDTRDILEEYEFPMPEGSLTKTPGDAVKIANRIGFPVILKSLSLGASKTEALNSPDEVKRVYQEISKDATEGLEVIIQKHAAQGMEVIVGMTRDPELGPIVTFGLSGVFAFLKDVSSKVGPVSKEEAIKMIKETEAHAIIKGDGEKRKSDIEAIADAIEKVSRLSMENGNITEIDINPLFVYEKGASVIDARIVVE